MGNLFERGGLQQDTGLLKERWGQEGSSVLNLYDSVSADTTLHTVTTNKTAYIKQITISSQSGGGSDAIFVKDGSTTKIFQTLQSGSEMFYDFVFQVPLEFTSSIELVEQDSINCRVTMTGWEE